MNDEILNSVAKENYETEKKLKLFKIIVVILFLFISVFSVIYYQKSKDQVEIVITCQELEMNITTNQNLILNDLSNYCNFSSEDYIIFNSKYINKKELTSIELKEFDQIEIEDVKFEEIIENLEIPFSVKEQKTEELELGIQEIKIPGHPGEKQIVYEHKFVNDKLISKTKIGEEILKKPVDELILIGTKEKEKPVIKEEKPIIKEEKPIIKEEKPIIKEEKPIIKEEENCSININGVSIPCS